MKFVWKYKRCLMKHLYAPRELISAVKLFSDIGLE